MTTFDKINRRTHLYLGLFLMPWLLMYGVSSFIIIHESWFGAGQQRQWELLYEKQYQRPVPANQTDLRPLAEAILQDCNLAGAFWVDKPNPDTIHIDRFSFWGSTGLTYFIKEGKLKVETQRMALSQAIMRMHFRGGYDQPTFWDKFWGLLVDVACLGRSEERRVGKEC